MTPTTLARLRKIADCAPGPESLITLGTPDDIAALLAQRDRYEKALREIDGLLDGTTSMTRHIKKLVQKALRCE